MTLPTIDLAQTGANIVSLRKAAGLTQKDFVVRSGLGLRFVCELEQGKPTVRMAQVNTVLSMFGMEAVPGRKDADRWRHSEPAMSI